MTVLRRDMSTREAEWELAARGGFQDAEFAWGEEFTPGGRHLANTWQGLFPHRNLKTDGDDRTSPVTAFPPNGHDASDVIGNVWEWTADCYGARHAGVPRRTSMPRCRSGPVVSRIRSCHCATPRQARRRVDWPVGSACWNSGFMEMAPRVPGPRRT